MPGAPLTPKKAAERRAKWISECSDIHDGKYCYSKVIFVNKKTDVIITCPDHGDFSLTPQKHLDGQGCSSCPQPKKSPRNQIQYRGELFDSKEKLADHLGVSRRTLSNRIRDGWSQEDWGVRQRKSWNNIEYLGKKYPTLKDLSEAIGVHKKTLQSRIERGWSQENWAMDADEARKHRARRHHDIAEEVARTTRFKLLGLYTGRFKDARFFCLKHYEIYECRPGNILVGQGLQCCARAFAKENPILQSLSNEEYDKRLAKHGRAERLEDYINNSTSIRHRCLIHNQTMLAMPATLLSGQGMRCCALASIQAQADRRKDKAAGELVQVLKKTNPNIVWVGGEYKGDREKLSFYCLRHDETHLSIPGRVKLGTGLKCCHRAASVESGRKMGLINGGEHDNVWRALTGKLKRGQNNTTFLYLYESPFNGFSKYGISSSLERREKSGDYGEQLIEPHSYPKRSDAVLIEQAFKYGWGIERPEEASEYAGGTELTELKPLEFEEIIEELECAFAEMGAWRFAEEFCDPYEIHKARSENAD